MKAIIGLLGRDDLVETVAREARKGRHLLLTGPVGIGKSAILEAVIDRLIVRRDRIVLHVNEHQAKGQFLEIARGLLIGARYLAIGTGDTELYIFAVPVPGGRQGQLARIIALSRQLRYK